ncbi:uncharacterized protein VTP21DRAFT_11596 [Calcarisporiella thermophila]|uniref:uncharacterized protein n=1 Tax=Calcarisporiella thermophila TaxID=911321 RepID=UPI0037431279
MGATFYGRPLRVSTGYKPVELGSQALWQTAVLPPEDYRLDLLLNPRGEDNATPRFCGHSRMSHLSRQHRACKLGCSFRLMGLPSKVDRILCRLAAGSRPDFQILNSTLIPHDPLAFWGLFLGRAGSNIGGGRACNRLL